MYCTMLAGHCQQNDCRRWNEWMKSIDSQRFWLHLPSTIDRVFSMFFLCPTSLPSTVNNCAANAYAAQSLALHSHSIAPFKHMRRWFSSVAAIIATVVRRLSILPWINWALERQKKNFPFCCWFLFFFLSFLRIKLFCNYYLVCYLRLLFRSSSISSLEHGKWYCYCCNMTHSAIKDYEFLRLPAMYFIFCWFLFCLIADWRAVISSRSLCRATLNIFFSVLIK